MYKEHIKSLIDYNLSQDGFLILYCLYTKNEYLIKDYTSNCSKIDSGIFTELEQKKLLNISNKSDHILYEFLSLTKEGHDLIKLLLERSKHSSESIIPSSEALVGNFDDFRNYYPKVVKDGRKIRRLHGDLRRCRKSYEKLLQETTHEVLCKSAKLYHEESKRSNSEYYMKSLEAWLNQSMYTVFEEEELEDRKEAEYGNDI